MEKGRSTVWRCCVSLDLKKPFFTVSWSVERPLKNLWIVSDFPEWLCICLKNATLHLYFQWSLMALQLGHLKNERGLRKGSPFPSSLQYGDGKPYSDDRCWLLKQWQETWIISYWMVLPQFHIWYLRMTLKIKKITEYIEESHAELLDLNQTKSSVYFTSCCLVQPTLTSIRFLVTWLRIFQSSS